ncbi:uncharacterized protein AB675_9952 [Cyphellophora attinorum]|uniref:Secreted protein n=1 Tax=Cyphellophora attinorum TaxID=1664694 RepID=A0A0N1HLE6_9EURO|nr:uncharacterized protein AB675_9952 [Phialophora attinorum]KPI35332.1 hypothetical protein AB675_9952 [Phialophora attinorum]
MHLRTLAALAVVSCLVPCSVLCANADDESSSYEVALTEIPSGSRATYGDYSAATSTLTAASSSYNSTTQNATSSTRPTSSQSLTSETQTTIVGTASSGSASSDPTNSAKCNGYTEFCGRKYSNITYVVAHNSPFHIPNNGASNQDLDVITQLDDGVRGIQSETHYVNDTVVLCHTSCQELNAGTLEEYLIKVKAWLDTHRYEVITIILGNEDFIDPGNYTAPVTNSGILDYVYTPPTQPMDIDGWPTLAEMIISNKRVVMFLAYDANQNKIPWLLDMWSYQWQTPFSPTNVSFPCSVQRPPGQERETSQNRLYLANHNLNIQFDDTALGIDILVPNLVEIQNTNANTTSVGAAKTMVDQCTSEWGRPPNFLLVDYFNYGNFNGSTLAAAAEANNVTYDVDSCCGTQIKSSASTTSGASWICMLIGAGALLLLVQ